MRTRTFVTLSIIALFVVFALSDANAYRRYNDGCQNCHGNFLDGTSPQGTMFPFNSKHEMHRSSSYMGTNCNLCHTSGDGRNPYTGSSTGTNDTPGMGCTGCHERSGLRAHHFGAGVMTCVGCHPSDPAPPSEDTLPAYYTSPDTNIAEPCNPTAEANVNENWSTGDFLGLDNDGDGLYDGADPDCSVVTATPGLLDGLLVAAHDRTNQVLTVNYDNTACQVSNANFYFGPLDQVGSSSYAGEDCGIGNSGSYPWNYPVAPEAVFFLVVGHDGTQEGSYGTDSSGTERGAAGLCPQSQDLANRCDLTP